MTHKKNMNLKRYFLTPPSDGKVETSTTSFESLNSRNGIRSLMASRYRVRLYPAVIYSLAYRIQISADYAITHDGKVFNFAIALKAQFLL